MEDKYIMICLDCGSISFYEVGSYRATFEIDEKELKYKYEIEPEEVYETRCSECASDNLVEVYGKVEDLKKFIHMDNQERLIYLCELIVQKRVSLSRKFDVKSLIERLINELEEDLEMCQDDEIKKSIVQNISKLKKLQLCVN